MIVFDLNCINGHTFEGWFEDGRAYDAQKKKGLIACPSCNTTEVTKILSPVAIKMSQSSEREPAVQLESPEVLKKKVFEYIEQHFDNVGCEFTKEALKIHYGATEPRNIRGVSTQAEEKILEEEGIEFFKIPTTPPPDTEN